MTNKALSTAIAIGAIVGAFLLVSVGGLAGWAFSRSLGSGWSGWGWPWQMGSWLGPGMMGGRFGSCGATGDWPGSWGMMGGWSSPGGIVGLGGRGCGLQSGSIATGEVSLSLAEAGEAVEAYLASANLPDLAVAEVMEFSNHLYAEVEEESTGVHAMELLIDKNTGEVYPEPGPNMMWNTKYGMHSRSGWGGMMGGMMGGFGAQVPSAAMPVSAEQAVEYAQRYLDAYAPGKRAADEADGFYGYYTIHVLDDGQVYGMLGVNGYTGQVWYHSWHGQFVDMLELEHA
ncbi:MAG: PepSY domain-containing protein [Anaerolineae bacterium]|nr:PepSY domain-containing protein [Anaerolineae bacterium]